MGRISKLLTKYFPVSTSAVSEKFKRRIIWDHGGKGPYLARFYITRPPWMKDGSEPFDKNGDPKPNAVWPDGLSLVVHHFYRSDSDLCLHNHPWKWALSLVLAGGYSEERRTKHDRVIRRTVRPGMLNLLTDNTFHRVDLLTPERGAWSLFLMGPKVKSWGFWDRYTREFTPWREFLNLKDARVQA